MNCPNCGAALQPGATFCHACGASQVQPSQEPGWNVGNQANDMPMKWFKFLIYFALFAGALLNFINGITLLTGSHYEGKADLVYAFFEELKSLDLTVGILSIVTALVGLFARFRLAGFHRNGPTMLTITYVMGIVTQLIYIIGISAVAADNKIDIDMTSNISSMCTSVAMVFVNISYFKKRAHLFTK